MIHVRIDDNELNADAKFACGIKWPLPPGDKYWFQTESGADHADCPNGCEWEIDRWSSNGAGWRVTGELPRITCVPSIICGDYHGFLRDGEFTAPL
jgi:Family of unknown function (DUF6527)